MPSRPRTPGGGFKISGLSVDVPEVEALSNTERAMLRGMAEPGGPLWKIMRTLIDYGEGLKASLVSADLDFNDPQDQQVWRKVQATYQATVWVQSTFENALTDVPEAARNEEKV